MARSEFLRQVTARGFLHQCTDIEGLDALAAAKTLTAYIGFDCTAVSLHVGSLVPIMLLRLLQKSGHKPIVLVGGGTTKVGDPSGKNESRRLLADREIARNMAGIRKVFAKFITFGEGPTDAVMVDNAEWLDELAHIPFLRDYGRHFSVNRMLGLESVKSRLERERPLSFLEFNYMVLQAYDFLELARRWDCVLQMGGSDQWGNIVGGVELARRIDGRTLFGLTSPLITTASGEKMGKTARGSVWLTEEKLSAYEYWQYWRNAADADVGRFLRLFTELPLDEVARLEALGGSEINEAKKALADEATRLCHGDVAVREAEASAVSIFEEGGTGFSVIATNPDGSPVLETSLPVIDVRRSELKSGIPIFELLRRAGLAASNSEARRLIQGGGGRINDAVIDNELRLVTLADVDGNGVIRLAAGKKRHALIRAVQARAV